MPERAPELSRSGRERAEAGEAGRGVLPLVVTHETIVRENVDRGGDMDRIEGPQRRLRQRPGRQEECTVKRSQADRVDEPRSALHEGFDGQAWIEGSGSPDGSRELGQHQLTGDQVGVFEERPQGSGFGLAADQLDKGRRIGVEERQGQRSPRIWSSAWLSA